ncbi:hypothetical protein M8494_25205 [Serratia ureilytica]
MNGWIGGVSGWQSGEEIRPPARRRVSQAVCMVCSRWINAALSGGVAGSWRVKT